MKMELTVHKNNIIGVRFPDQRVRGYYVEDHAQKGRLLNILANRAVKWSISFIIMKMMMTYPTVSAALADYNNTGYFHNGELQINYKDQNDTKRVCDELKNIAKDMNAPKETGQDVYLYNFSNVLQAFTTTALCSFAFALVMSGINKAILKHQPNPNYVYAGFAAMLAGIYASGSVPIIMPNIAALSVGYLSTKYLLPAVGEGQYKSAALLCISALPTVAACVVAIPLYSSMSTAVIATAGVLVGSHCARIAHEWYDPTVVIKQL